MDRYFFATNAFDTTDAANLVGRDRARVFRIIPVRFPSEVAF